MSQPYRIIKEKRQKTRAQTKKYALILKQKDLRTQEGEEQNRERRKSINKGLKHKKARSK